MWLNTKRRWHNFVDRLTRAIALALAELHRREQEDRLRQMLALWYRRNFLTKKEQEFMEHEHDNMQDFKGSRWTVSNDCLITPDSSVCVVNHDHDLNVSNADLHAWAASTALFTAAFYALDGRDCFHEPGEVSDTGFCKRCLIRSAIRGALNNPKWTPTGDDETNEQ